MINKYKLKIVLVPILAKFGRLVGKTWPQLGDRLGRETMLAQADEILAGKAPTLPQASQTLDVIFLTMLGGHTHNSAVDIVLGLALRARGHNVKFVICDQSLSACEVKKSDTKQHWETSCNKCWVYGKTLFKKFNFEIIPTSQLTGELPSHEEAERWERTVEASLLKHFKVGFLSNSPEVAERRRQYQKAVQQTHAIGKALIKMAPDRVIMSHGIYSTWGPQHELLVEQGIPVLTYSKCKKLSTEKFNWNTSGDWWDVSSEWNKVRETPLNQTQTERIDTYLSTRRNHSKDTLKYNFGEEESKTKVFERLKLDNKKKTFVAFTNVLWDAASAHREIVFPSPVEWILETIEWFRKKPQIQLVVKIHPAELVIGTNQSFMAIINSRIPKLPENVRIIEPHEKVNSWSIMQIADLGLVHTSTIGMEMPLEKIPCATVSKTHYRGRGFTIDVSDRAQYFDLIKDWNVTDYDLDQMQTLAKRYAFLLFERYQLPFKFFYEPNHTDVRALNFDTLKELSYDPIMSFIVNSIEQKQEFLLPANFLEIDDFPNA